MSLLIEIATSDFSTTSNAVKGGADRIELCANLAEGGVTPSYGLLEKCRVHFSLPIFPIIRPRGGDFIYTDEEFDIMIRDMKLCRKLGYDGIVAGILNVDGSIDKKRMRKLINHAYPMAVTFHRAFDRCRDAKEGIEDVIELGCERLLTSGQQPDAIKGLDLISELQRDYGHQIIIMPGSGIRKDNIKMIAEKTGCREFHSSLKNVSESKSEFRHPAFVASKESYFNNSISPEQVEELRKELQSI